MPGRPTCRSASTGAGRSRQARLRTVVCRANPRATFVCVSEGVAGEMRDTSRARLTVSSRSTTESIRGRSPPACASRRQRPAEPSGHTREELVLAFVGGDWEHKGLRSVIEALPQAPGWHLVVAGRGHRGRLPGAGPVARRAAKGALDGGRGGRAARLRARRRIRTPSTYETFSLVTFEAASSGLPILATDVNGVRELIEDGQNGFLIARERRGYRPAPAPAGRRPGAAQRDWARPPASRPRLAGGDGGQAPRALLQLAARAERGAA